MAPEGRSAPSCAELARTAVAFARVAALTTYPRHERPMVTSASVTEQDGGLLLCLPSGSLATRTLLVRPLATVRLAPAGCEVTTVQGSVRRLPEQPARQTTRFVLEPGSVRVGNTAERAVQLDDYLAAEPDPLREQAPVVLAHLRSEHAAGLADCLRAQGHHAARWVEPVGLDRYGLELLAVDDDGVAKVRLTFPTPVRSIRDLPPHLYLALRGRCADCRERRDL